MPAVTGAEQEQDGKVNILALTFNFTRNNYLLLNIAIAIFSKRNYGGELLFSWGFDLMLSSFHSEGFQELTSSETVHSEHPKWRLNCFQKHIQYSPKAEQFIPCLLMSDWSCCYYTAQTDYFALIFYGLFWKMNSTFLFFSCL